MTETAQEKLQSEIAGRLEGVRSKIAIPLISILLAFIVGTIILVFMAADPITSFYYMTLGTFTPTKLADTLFNATPLLFTGLSVAVAFRGGMFNIGTEGQMIFGGFCSALVGFGLNLYFGITLPAIVMIPLLLIAGMVGGALWAFIPGLLKAKRGVHEVITTIMLNYVALTLMVFLVGDLSSPFIDQNYGSGNVSPQSPKIAESGKIGTVANSFIDTLFRFIVEPFKYSRFHWGFFIGIIACFVVYLLLWKTKFGYETRAVGYNPHAAKYGGINVSNNTIKVMMVSGALGGIAGAIEVMALWMRFVNGFSSLYGFDGIAVALIGGNHPIGVIFGALLFGWLKSGGQVLQIKGMSRDLANTLKGLIVFFVAVPLIAKSVISHFNNSEQYIKYCTNLKIIEAKKEESMHDSVWKRFFHKGRALTSFIIGVIAADTSSLFNKLRINFRSIINIVFIMIVVFLTTSGIIFIAPIIQQMGDAFFSPISAILTSYELIKPINDFFSSLFSIEILLLGIALILSALVSYKSRQRGQEKIIKYFFFLITGIFGVIFGLKAADIFGQEITLLILISIIIAFILVQEVQARKSTAEERANLSAIPITVRQRRAVIIYTIFTAVLLAFLGFIIYLSPGIIPLPFSFGTSILLPKPYNFFFFTLADLGALIAAIAVVFIIISLLVLGRYELPRKNRLSAIFKVFSLLTAFLTFAVIFNLNSTLLFTMTLSIATPIGLASLGGMFSEKSGVVNIGLEGMMLTGCFVSVWISYETGDPWAGVLGAIIAGGLMGLLHAIASIKFRADQVVVGVAINLLATALTTLGLIAVWNVRGTSPTVTGLSELVEIPIVGQLLYALSGGNSGLSPLVYLFIVIIFISGWVIQKTSFGLRVRAVGEHPRAADTLGINVFMIRYICVVLSGILAGLGGAMLTLGTVPIFGKGMTTGRGFVALAALIFGAWNPIGAALASLLFGFAYAFRFQLDASGASWLLEIPTIELIFLLCIPIIFALIAGLIIIKAVKTVRQSEVLDKTTKVFLYILPVVIVVAVVSQIFIIAGADLFLEKLTPTLPFLITIIAVATVAKRGKAPAADGIPYIKEG
ncbi:MAG: ABC transporter permease subunit [Candidatus Hodarchaeales archaeon]